MLEYTLPEEKDLRTVMLEGVYYVGKNYTNGKGSRAELCTLYDLLCTVYWRLQDRGDNYIVVDNSDLRCSDSMAPDTLIEALGSAYPSLQFSHALCASRFYTFFTIKLKP